MRRAEAGAHPRGDARRDRWALLAGSGTVCAFLSVGAAAHAAWSNGLVLPGQPATEFATRLLANSAMVVVDLLMLVALRSERRRRPWEHASAILTASVVAAAARIAVLMSFGLYELATAGTWLTEYVSGFIVAVGANVLGLLFLTSQQRVRREVRTASESAVQYRIALAALEREEIRVRRDVAEGLHGSLQQRLVLLTARIDALADRLAAGQPTEADLADLRAVSATLNQVRESDVREISRMLYPDGIEVGLVPAVRSLLVRLPAAIATHLEVADGVRLLDDPASPLLTQSERLLAVRVVEEGITNALRHGAATRIEVRIGVDGGALRLRVSDDGSGFDGDEDVRRSGTARLTERLALAGGWLGLSSVPGEGAVLEAAFPVTAAVTG